MTYQPNTYFSAFTTFQTAGIIKPKHKLFLTKSTYKNCSYFSSWTDYFSKDRYQTAMSSSSWLWDFQISLQPKYEKILFCSGMRSSLDKVVQLNYSSSLGCLYSNLSRNLSKYKLIRKRWGKKSLILAKYVLFNDSAHNNTVKSVFYCI